jgi:hypothetical protein
MVEVLIGVVVVFGFALVLGLSYSKNLYTEKLFNLKKVNKQCSDKNTHLNNSVAKKDKIISALANNTITQK